MNDSRDPLAQLVDADRAVAEPGDPALDRVWSGIERGLASGTPGPVLDTKPLLAPGAGWGLGVVSVVVVALLGASLVVAGARPDAVAARTGLLPPIDWPALPDSLPDSRPEPEPVEPTEHSPRPAPTVAAPAPPERSSRTSPRSASKPAALEPELGLTDELRLMRSLSQALARGNTTLASSLLRQHERQFPKGALLEERSAAAARIACTRDDANAGAKRAAFETRWPKSMHAAAVRKACED